LELVSETEFFGFTSFYFDVNIISKLYKLRCIELYQTTVNVTSHFKTGKSSAAADFWHSTAAEKVGVSQKTETEIYSELRRRKNMKN